MVTERPFPSPGDRVLVPWGLEEVLGEVIEVYPTGLGDRAIVRLIESSDPDATVTVPADTLSRVDGFPSGISPRLDSIAFEISVVSALQDITGELSLHLGRRSQPDQEFDAIITDRITEIAVQIKYLVSRKVSSDTVSALAGYTRHGRTVVLVTNAELTPTAYEHLRRLNINKQLAWFVIFNGPSDYPLLRAAIEDAFGQSRARSRRR